jgi:8-oxo-dGTP diphosphatase
MIKERHKIIPAIYLVLMQENRLLMLRRFNTWYEDGNYSLVAGHLDWNETFKQAMARETLEESWITLNIDDINVTHVMHRRLEDGEDTREYIDFFMTVKNFLWNPVNMEPHKCDDLSWFPLDDIPTNTIPYIKHALDNISKWLMYSEYGF